MFATRGTPDLLFFLNTALLVHKGAIPHIDFQHPYGGLLSVVLAKAYDVVGIDVKANDLAKAFFLGLAVVSILLAAWNRLRILTTAGLVILCCAILATTIPFEAARPSAIINAHNFLYNRIGWSFAGIALMVGFFQSDGTAGRITGGLALGMAAFVIVFTKMTFLVVLFPVGLAMLFDRRFVELGLATAVFSIAWIVFAYSGGYGPLGLWLHIQDLLRLGGEFNRGPLTFWFKLAWLTVFNVWDIIFCLLLVASLVTLEGYRRRWFAPLVVATILAGLLATAVTGSFKILSVSTPIFAILALAVGEAVARAPGGLSARRVLVVALCCFVVASLSSVHIASLLVETARGAGVRTAGSRNFGDAPVFHSGPMARYVIAPANRRRYPSKQAALDAIAGRLALEGSLASLDEFEYLLVLADAVQLLKASEGGTDRAVFAPYRIAFPFLAGTKAVLTMPFYEHEQLYERIGFHLVGDIDAVLLIREDRSTLATHYRNEISKYFKLKHQSKFWDYYEK